MSGRPEPNSSALKNQSSGGCLLPTIIALLVVGGIAYFFYRQLGFQGILDKLYPNHKEVEIIDPSKNRTNACPRKVEKPVVSGERDDGGEDAAKSAEPVKKSKTVAEMKSEADSADLRFVKEVEEARKTSRKSLPAFAGIRFGAAMPGPFSSLEKLPPNAMGEKGEDAFCYVTFGEKLPGGLRQFEGRPRVYVTAESHKAFRIELTHALVRRPGWKLSSETTNLVARLSLKFGKPISPDIAKIPLATHAFVFPMGETTLTVGEYGGEQMKLIVENSRFRAMAVGESESFRRQAAAETATSKILASDKYPNGGMVKMTRIRQKKGTPKAFAGVVFGSLPPYSSTVSAPSSRRSARYFFVDYRKAKLEPFLNFDHGRAELSSVNGAVVAVKLYSNGVTEGLTEAEYARHVCAAIEKRFKVQPVRQTSAKDGVGAVTYEVGSLRITFSPDPNGGFSLVAEQMAMKAVW